MTAKYPGQCGRCQGAIARGDVINFYGRGHAEHAYCPATGPKGPKGPDAPCWECKAPEGYFRNLGAATPVWCDACFAKAQANDRWNGGEDERAGLKPGTLANDRRLAASGLTVIRFSSGESITQNARGRCEDAPCCGCCS